MIAAIKKHITATVGFIGAFLTSASTALAQISNPVIGELGSQDMADEAAAGTLFVRYFVQLWNVIISVGAIVVIVMFLWGALEWITAGGDTGKVQSAQKRMMNSAIGIFLLVASFAIIQLVSLLFFDGEFNILNLELPTPDNGGQTQNQPMPPIPPDDNFPI